MAHRISANEYELNPDKENLCGYHYAFLSDQPECCGLLKEKGDTRCIFHSENDIKDLNKFTENINIHHIKSEKNYDFEGYVFPREFDFSLIYPFGRYNDLIFNERHIVDQQVNFINCTFYCFTRFTDINFQKPVSFEKATFNIYTEFNRSIFISSVFNDVTFNENVFFNRTQFKECYFHKAHLEKARFHHSSLEKCDLSSIEYSDITKQKILIDTYTSNTNRVFAREAADYNYLEELKLKKGKKLWFKAWKVTSDYGRSILRWTYWCSGLIILFAFLFFLFSKPSISFWSALYSSISLFTTLGLGDLSGKSIGVIRILTIIEVIFGYFMLGVLISIFSEKIARRS